MNLIEIFLGAVGGSHPRQVGFRANFLSCHCFSCPTLLSRGSFGRKQHFEPTHSAPTVRHVTFWTTFCAGKGIGNQLSGGPVDWRTS